MTTNKPEVVAWLYERTKLGNIFEDEPSEGFWFVPETEDGPRSYIKGQPVIRLSDYEARMAVLFDGHAVYSAMTDKAKQHTSPESVAAVLDAVVKLMKEVKDDNQ